MITLHGEQHDANARDVPSTCVFDLGASVLELALIVFVCGVLRDNSEHLFFKLINLITRHAGGDTYCPMQYSRNVHIVYGPFQMLL